MSNPPNTVLGPTDVRLACIAQSGATIATKDGIEGDNNTEQCFYKHLQFSNDGTSVIVQRSDHSLDTFVLPQDLLDVAPVSQELQIQSHATSPSSLRSFDVHPSFTLSDTTTTWVASSSVDVPITLKNALKYDFTTVSYPWVSPTTEQYISANSLLFVAQGAYFAAGSKGRLALFDVSRPGERPVTVHAGGKRQHTYGEGLQDQGLVMALAESDTGVLAAGTTSRNVVLFPAAGHGKPEAHFSLNSSRDATDECDGTGVMSLAWSPCERYLIVAERQSDCMQVFDIRNGGERLAWLSGRNALSTQRFDVDLVRTPDGYEIWSGSVDGHVRMWQNPGQIGGEQRPYSASLLSNQPIGSARWHPSGAVLATCAGGQKPVWDDKCEASVADDGDSVLQKHDRNRLSIWVAG